MAYKADERYYLFEHQPEPEQIGISANDTLEMKARKIFDAYSDTALPYAVSPVPKSVALNNASVERKTLILDFNEEFLKVYEDRTDLRQMMVESLVYTFTTIPGVDSIKITAQGKAVSYTHLDVYKRQAHINGNQLVNIIRNAGTSVACFFICG